MRIVSRSAIREFVERCPAAEASLDTWYRTARRADWANIAEVKSVYPHADAVGKCTVFNVHGNRYRLIAHINHDHRTLYIRGIYTHDEYDREDWKNDC
jgi:mRNA interferase HigB